ncbi:MAG TPA: zinc dependent phospholipase C family protein [Bacteroidales bacterium]|nr:zinc dependent phospholipase C family protein [Bacteroidales bacterium]
MRNLLTKGTKSSKGKKTFLRPGGLNLPALLLAAFISLLPALDSHGFGFNAHRRINRMAVFTLPPEMIGFFKKHIEYLSERSIDPDRRAHAVPGEAPRHYIDMENFGSEPFKIVPRRWDEAVEKFTQDTLLLYGVLPWHINVMMGRLTRAFIDQDIEGILYNAAHIGHYIADACTPLHTTKFYNGRVPKERGIHALWETRIPEMLAQDFDYFVGRAGYIPSPRDRAWELVEISHNQVGFIYQIYDSLMTKFTADQIFVHEMRGQVSMRYFSREFALALHHGMDKMVEQHMRLAVKSVGDFWYTAWVNAGQPDLYKLETRAISRRHRRMMEREQRAWDQIEQPVGRTYQE